VRRIPVFRSFTDFYPFYLGEHTHPTCRRLHFVGTTLAVALLLTALATQRWILTLAALIEAYGCAWVGHFFFEHNKPATFKHPVFSFMGDWCLWWDILRGRQQIGPGRPNSRV
jgi:hypothetical protein